MNRLHVIGWDLSAGRWWRSPLQPKARPCILPASGNTTSEGGRLPWNLWFKSQEQERWGSMGPHLLCKNKCGKTLSISPLSAASLSQVHQIRRHILVMIERLGHCISQVIFYQKAGRTVWSLDRYANAPLWELFRSYTKSWPSRDHIPSDELGGT